MRGISTRQSMRITFNMPSKKGLDCERWRSEDSNYLGSVEQYLHILLLSLERGLHFAVCYLVKLMAY